MVLRQAVRTQGAGGLRMCCPVPGLAPQGSLPFPLSFPPRAVACCRLAWGHARGHAPTPAPSFDQRLPALLGRHDWQRPPPPGPPGRSIPLSAVRCLCLGSPQPSLLPVWSTSACWLGGGMGRDGGRGTEEGRGKEGPFTNQRP